MVMRRQVTFGVSAACPWLRNGWIHPGDIRSESELVNEISACSYDLQRLVMAIYERDYEKLCGLDTLTHWALCYFPVFWCFYILKSLLFAPEACFVGVLLASRLLAECAQHFSLQLSFSARHAGDKAHAALTVSYLVLYPSCLAAGRFFSLPKREPRPLLVNSF